MPSDEGIWADYAKSVKRVKRRSLPKGGVRGGEVSEEAPSPAKAKDLLRKPELSLPLPLGERKDFVTVVLDKRIERKLRAGELAIDARLDMHGMTQKEAHAVLGEFIAVQVNRGSRNLLIITGKGRDGAGALKTNFKTWLENLPEAGCILAMRAAAIKHGGTGAFYVFLRKLV